MRNSLLVALAIAACLPSSIWAQQGGQPGVFDYYVLSLSWVPEYCHSHPSNPECSGGQHYAFRVHGLWPQFRNGGGPENCSNAPGLSNPASALDIMPDPGLIAHEWSTHGTCSGLSATAYFDLIRKAFNSIRIPRQFAAPSAPMTMSPLQVKQAFEQSNPALRDASIMIACPGNYLHEVEICMDKTLNPIPCSAPRDCSARAIRIAPVR